MSDGLGDPIFDSPVLAAGTGNGLQWWLDSNKNFWIINKDIRSARYAGCSQGLTLIRSSHPWVNVDKLIETFGLEA